MKVLVLRPQPAATRTARALTRLGHEAVVAPLIVIARAPGGLAESLAQAPPAAVIAASANAVEMLDAESRGRLAGLKALVVGARTARAAASIGLDPVAPVFRTAAELASALRARRDVAPRGRLLYLAGHDRKPDIEAALRQGGYRFELAETYRAEIAPYLPAVAEAALREASLDAVLHYSIRSAAAFARLAGAAGLGAQAFAARQLCLSEEVAQCLVAAGAARVESAASPDESHLLALLAPDRRLPAGTS